MLMGIGFFEGDFFTGFLYWNPIEGRTRECGNDPSCAWISTTNPSSIFYGSIVSVRSLFYNRKESVACL